MGVSTDIDFFNTLYVALTSEQVAQFWNIRWTYHTRTKQDSERRERPTLALKLYVEHVIVHRPSTRPHFQS